MVSFFFHFVSHLGKAETYAQDNFISNGGRIVFDKHFTSNFAKEDLYCECFDTVLGDHI